MTTNVSTIKLLRANDIGRIRNPRLEVHKNLDMFIFLLDQCPISVVHKAIHLYLARDHACRLDLTCSDSINHALEVLFLVTQYALVIGFSED